MSHCPLCDAGFPLNGVDHIPSQAKGMIPVTRCRNHIPRGAVKRFRELLNRQDAARAEQQAAVTNPVLRVQTKHRNGRFHQGTRLYGDYLYAQDHDKFMADLCEWIAQGEPGSHGEIELAAMPDEKLDEVFAVEVAGWRFHRGNKAEEWTTLREDWWIADAECDRRGPATMFKSVHKFTSDANAILPWLSRGPWSAQMQNPREYEVTVSAAGNPRPIPVNVKAAAFARAAVLAMILVSRSRR